MTWLGGLAALIVIGTTLVALVRFLINSHTKRHTLAVSRDKAKEIDLEAYLATQGLSLCWHNANTVDDDVQSGVFQKIRWRDPSGKVWRLVDAPRGDFPLAKKSQNT